MPFGYITVNLKKLNMSVCALTIQNWRSKTVQRESRIYPCKTARSVSLCVNDGIVTTSLEFNVFVFLPQKFVNHRTDNAKIRYM